MAKSLSVKSVSLAACGASFSGSRTGNDSEFVMEYSIFNTSDAQDLRAEAGDTIHAELAVEGGVCRHAAVWTDSMDESFAQPLARGLEGCPFRVEDLCLRVEEAPACREVAADLCALLRRQDI